VALPRVLTGEKEWKIPENHVLKHILKRAGMVMLASPYFPSLVLCVPGILQQTKTFVWLIPGPFQEAIL
jgi:hypothetical protein